MDIKARILARPDLAELHAARDLDGLAAALNAEGLTVTGERYVTTRTILAECSSGPAIVAAIRQTAGVDPVVDEALNFLRDDSGFDVGHERTGAIIAQLVTAGALQPQWADEMLAMALRPLIVSRFDVNEAMFNPDGTEKS